MLRTARPYLAGLFLPALLSLSFPGSTATPELYLPQANSNWFVVAQETLHKNLAHAPVKGKAKSIILFIGDGMGVSTVTASRIFEGQSLGMMGEDHVLAWEVFPNVALSKTYNVNQQVPDSAGTATAFMTGVKTKAGVISVDQSVTRGDCLSSRGHHVTSFLELAEQRGLATGIVTTSRLTHATPATAYAHVPERDWENDVNVPLAEKAAGCKDIALQFLEFPHGNGIEVAFGGGRENFLPLSLVDGEGDAGKRADERNLIAEWRQKYPDGRYIWNEAMLRKLSSQSAGPVLGLFDASHMAFEADRVEDVGGEPSLAAMTAKALQILQQHKDGYFLLVEAALVDKGHHAGNAYRALSETVALAEAVDKALEMTSRSDTLIIVTADHSHTLTMGGAPTRGNPILGKVRANNKYGKAQDVYEKALDDKAYTTLGYHYGPGATLEKHRTDVHNTDTSAKNFKQPSLVPLREGMHAGEDVAVYARGPSAHLIRGVVEQNYLYHVMVHAARL
ncbi:alkaline phosphatase [Seongchinamella unica]|uniref:Alkaline phosphatase n=1 Tax=Seongchinamella unica TaxID=2547392 RepID=A0A4R5LTN8_9GAMM|nr:alkaline phosphatase [Seongchinamella unica]TDG14681.1 alkaline phosphatase [Seongchinamella unica]